MSWLDRIPTLSDEEVVNLLANARRLSEQGDEKQKAAAAELLEPLQVEADQRKRMVWLTEKGARRLEAALASWRQAHAKLAEHLSVDLVGRLAREARDL